MSIANRQSPIAESRAETFRRAEDLRRREFLAALDEAEFDVTDWEAQFLEDHLANPRPVTEAQRACIDRMREIYGSGL